MVLMPAGSERYFISWRGCCLLVSGANLKGATVEDANRHDLRLQEADVVLAKVFEDMTECAPPPEDDEAPYAVAAPEVQLRRRLTGCGRKESEARRMMAGLKSVKKVLKDPLHGVRRHEKRLLPRRVRPPRPSEPSHDVPEEEPPQLPVRVEEMEPQEENVPMADCGGHECLLGRSSSHCCGAREQLRPS